VFFVYSAYISQVAHFISVRCGLWNVQFMLCMF